MYSHSRVKQLRFLTVLLTLCVLCLFNQHAWSESSEASPRDDGYDFMQYLADHDLHDINHESWNIYGQATFINSWKSAFPAQYTNFNNDAGNSLLPGQERSFTGTATLYLSKKLWEGGELYFVPEVISERSLSGLKGLGSVIQNFELQKSGSQEPSFYMSRGFFKQSWGLGGSKQVISSDPMQLGTSEDSRRFVLRFGEFSILDFFDKNSYSGDLRKQFNNMAFLTYAAYDFAADARGYTWGLVTELIWDDWAARFGHILPPKDPNQLALNVQPFKYFGDQIEIEHKHTLWDEPGAVRLLAYRNYERIGTFTDAINLYTSNNANNAASCTNFNYGSTNINAPDLCYARKAHQKIGIGINFEQQVFDDAGLFLRAMVSDGKSEVYSYTSTDQSLSLGTIIKGTRWGRRKDTAGVGYAQGWLSDSHVKYLSMGGIDGFIGDGKIHYRPEQVVDIFYSFNVINTLWLTADYQHIANPAYNADRGPVDIYGARIHLEF